MLKISFWENKNGDECGEVSHLREARGDER